MAKKSLQLKPGKPYTAADVLTNVEVLTRAAALEQPELESRFRVLKDIEIADAETKRHVEAAVLNRTSQLDDRLQRVSARPARYPWAEHRLAELIAAKMSESRCKAGDAPEIVPKSERESQILAVFERKKFNPLSIQKIANLMDIPQNDVEALLLALGAVRTKTEEGTEVWSLPGTG